MTTGDPNRMQTPSFPENAPRVAILGAGNMGTALAHALARNGCEVTVWDHFPEVLDEIREHRTNQRFLADVALDPRIGVATTPAECVRNADIVIPCLPSRFIESVISPAIGDLKPGAILLNVAKGFAPGTTDTMPVWLERLLPGHPCAHLAGPCLAGELARGLPGGIVIAARHDSIAAQVADAFAGDVFIPFQSTDLTGAALAGILKNSYAIFLGLLSRLVPGEKNLEATALTLCGLEMECILTCLGAEPETIRGLSGMGDLIATGLAPNSHNRRFGVRLGDGETIDQIREHNTWLPEGATATPILLRLAEETGLRPPLLVTLNDVLTGTPPDAARIITALRDAAEG